MLNHGLYTDCAWTIPVTFTDTNGAAVNLSGFEYEANVYLDGALVFAFKSSGAGSSDGLIDKSAAATGVLTFSAQVANHAAVSAGLYRVHLKRDLADDIWAAEASLLVGNPGDVETYLKFDRTTGATVELPIVIGGTSSTDEFYFDGGSATTDFTSLPAFDFGAASGPQSGAIDLGSST